MTDDAQPAEGQGDDGGGAPYAEYLEAVPEQFREQVEPAFKKWDADVNKKFQDHAEYRKAWSPYEEAGINEYEPGLIQEVLQTAQDPMAYLSWVHEQSPELAQNAWEQYGEANGLFDSGEDEEESGGGEDFEAALAEQIEQRLSPIEQRFQEQDERERQQEAQSLVDAEFQALREEHGEAFDEDKEEATRAFARMIFESSEIDFKDAIRQGWERVQKLGVDAERGLVDDKLSQPNTPETGGRPNTGAKPVTDFAEAEKLARERLGQR